MCGILVSSGSSTYFKRALALQLHRGPDAGGDFRVGATLLGHRRLSVIDIDPSNNQPFISDDGNLVLVYNGEIYNFKELQKKYSLECRTSGDTEVLLRLYEKFGAACLNELNGMFAFVIKHRDSGEVFAARDRLGIKPLYIDTRSGSLNFSSEISSLLALNPDYEWDEEGLRQYLKLRACFGGKTIYQGIQQFPAGHFYKNSRLVQYWRLPEGEQSTPDEEELKSLVEDAINIRRLSDVPVGSYLSGGLDSTIVAGVAQVNDTWSVGFENLNEFKYADLAARKFGLAHDAYTTNVGEFLQTSEWMIKKRAEPLSVPNEVLIYLMTKRVKHKNTVVLSGEGADELFFGYDRIFRWARSQESFSMEAFDKMYCYGSHRDDEILDSVITPHLEVSNSVLDFTARFFQLDHLQGLLRRLDNSTMLASVEARVPFVDHRLVELMAGVSADYRMQSGIVKAPLKRMFSNLVPQEIIERKKIGFPVPLNEIFGFKNVEGETFMDAWLSYNLSMLSGSNGLRNKIINSIKN